jgi:hypothetical protein
MIELVLVLVGAAILVASGTRRPQPVPVRTKKR